MKLISAQSAQLIDKDGESYRKVIGPAKFFHNNTYLLCDTALWNVNTNIIDAMGHVRIIQDRTKLSSETLQYLVDEDMAKFRGSLVQLEDKDNNILRTRYLDYNTKDSVAVFQDGAAMRDKDGQIIESIYGTYDSKAKLFVFNDSVNMYLDTTFVKTSRLEYRSDLSTAYFGFATDMWQDDMMLSANDGWYDRSQELFFFRRKVHVLTEDRETWADSLYFYREAKNVEMLGNVELMDTTRNVFALAGRFEYTDSLSLVRMTRDPAIMSIMEEKGKVDTLYVGGDEMIMRGIRMCDIPEEWKKDSKKRLSDIKGDPVMEYRKKAAEEAAKAAEEAAKNDPNRPPDIPTQTKDKDKDKDKKADKAPAKKETKTETKPEAPPVLPPVDSLAMPKDTLAMPKDSLAVQKDTLAVQKDTLAVPAGLPAMSTDTLSTSAPKDTVKAEPPKDTTKVNFVWMNKNVRLFRRDMQMSSDSLTYTDLDSLVRLYKDPIFFNEGNRQYASDSIYMVIKNKQMQKAHLLSNAFITIQEDPVSYDQIRGTEMVAYFDSTTALTRFDALGGASSLFYLEEQNALATVNKVDAKMIYATFKDGDIERMYYYDNPKNDGYPSVQLPQDERTLKGFRWEPERRPNSPLDVTSLVPRASERTEYLAHPHAQFNQTETYFPGHINKIYRDIAIRDSLQVVRERARQREKDSLDRLKALPDTLNVPADSLKMAPDSLLQTLPDKLKAPADSLKSMPDSLKAGADSLKVGRDSLKTAVASKPELSEKERKAIEKEKERKKREAQKAKEKAAKKAAQEAKWAEADRIYEEKQAAKAQKKLDKERAKKLKMLRKLEKKAAKERKQFEKYLEKERRRLEKEQEKEKRKRKTE